MVLKLSITCLEFRHYIQLDSRKPGPESVSVNHPSIKIVMSAEVQPVKTLELMQPLLGDPKWKDPERRQSIQDNNRVKMEWQLSTSVWTMTCWVALPPARPCLVDTMKQIEILVLKRQSDI